MSILTKERKLLIRYHLQQAVQHARVFAPACWLGLSVVFFFVVLMGISRWSPYLLADDPPRQIEGVVSQNVKGGNPPQSVPAVGATVECGEYRCSAGVDGRFAMNVRGREKTIVPLIITFGSLEQVERVQLADGREKTICTFVLR